MKSLADIRTDLGFSTAGVERAAGWPSGRLVQLERVPDDLTDTEADTLTRLYGVDIEALVSGEEDAAVQPLAALLRGAGASLAADYRFELAEVATIAREYRALRAMLGHPSRWPVIEGFRDDTDYAHPGEGAPERLAAQARERLGLGVAPILTLGSLLHEQLGVLLVWVELPRDIDAFALAGPETGPVIALNVSGAHTSNAFTRRVTLAHELCHLLFDRGQLRAMDRFCRVSVPRRAPRRPHDDLPLDERIERRARAFAAAFLVPRAEGVRTWKATREPSRTRQVQAWMREWGIGYEAARGHLATLKCLDRGVRLSHVRTEPPPIWGLAEPGPPLEGLAADLQIPLGRRGDFFKAVLDAVREQAIAPSRARELLLLSREGWAELVARAPLRQRDVLVSGDVSSAVLADWL